MKKHQIFTFPPTPSADQRALAVEGAVVVQRLVHAGEGQPAAHRARDRDPHVRAVLDAVVHLLFQAFQVGRGQSCQNTVLNCNLILISRGRRNFLEGMYLISVRL